MSEKTVIKYLSRKGKIVEKTLHNKLHLAWYVSTLAFRVKDRNQKNIISIHINDELKFANGHWLD